MSMHGGRPPVFTPALEGSKKIIPQTAQLPPHHPYSQGPRMAFDSPRGYYPSALPPIGGPRYMNVMPGERGIPSMLARPRPRYMGPPSLMPYWGGYSIGPRYYPEGNIPAERSESERQVVPVPIRAPNYQPPPIINQPPPPRVMPVPIIYRRPVRQMAIIKDEPKIITKKTVKKSSVKPSSGSGAIARFRHVAIVAVFVATLKANLRKNLSNRPSSMFLFGIILKEIVAALHRIYLNPNGNIYPVLNDIIGPNCYDLAGLVHGGVDGREESVLVQELQYVIENIIYHITEIMPSTGVLGTHRKSAVFELIKSGKRFPDGYFWQVEMERLQFSEHGRTANLGDAESFMLMLGIFISRSLVTTILMKPVDYGLSSEALSDVAERNLRIVASALLFLVRRITIARGRGIMDMPGEIAKYLYTDAEMEHVYSKLSRTFNYCEGLLREWGTEYIRRLRASSMAS